MSGFSIDLFTIDVTPHLKNKKKIREWLLQLIHSEKGELEDININIIFCNDLYLLDLNQRYLKKNTLTDILSFDYSGKKTIEGDIYISTERVKENAKSYSQTFGNELLRIIAHGVLHLCGYKDKTKEEKKKMTEMEDLYLFLLKDSERKIKKKEKFESNRVGNVLSISKTAI